MAIQCSFSIAVDTGKKTLQESEESQTIPLQQDMTSLELMDEGIKYTAAITNTDLQFHYAHSKLAYATNSRGGPACG